MWKRLDRLQTGDQERGQLPLLANGSNTSRGQGTQGKYRQEVSKSSVRGCPERRDEGDNCDEQVSVVL